MQHKARVVTVSVCLGVLIVIVLVTLSARMVGAIVDPANLTQADLRETDLTLAVSGEDKAYVGYANQPHGGFVYSFLQSGGAEFDIAWSSVREYTATATTAATLPAWTNPGSCAAPAIQCGQLAVALPASGAPQRPDFWTLDGGSEADVADGWRRQPGGLVLHGREYHVILSTRDDIPAGVTLDFRWLPWDGRGTPDLPVQ